MWSNRTATQGQVNYAEKHADQSSTVAALHNEQDADRLLLGEEGAGPDGEPVQKKVGIPCVLCGVVL